VTAEPTANETTETKLVAVEETSAGDLERVLGGAMRLSELQEVRQAKVEAFRDRGIDPYPPRTHRGSTVREAKERFVAIEPSLPESGEDEVETTVSGRLVSRRHQGKTVFAHVRDGSGEL
jgi:lysyl-tRNA synthetase, class II